MRSITQAVKEKYNDDDDEDSSNSGFILFAPRSSPRERLPSTLILDHCNIDSVGDDEHLSSLCHEVKELDLAHNQISQWEEINKLISCFPKLSFLNLSCNTLGNVNANAPPISYSSLKKLVLNRVGISWNDLLPYLSHIPNLEELHLSFNQMEVPSEEINYAKTTFPKVAKLHFDGNRVEHRDHLHWISHSFPYLTSLVLCDCPLWTLRWKSADAREAQGKNMTEDSSSGSYCGSAEASSNITCAGDGKSSSCCDPLANDDCLEASQLNLFPHLRTVSLNNSLIECWEEVSHLREWPSLVELRIKSCPLFRNLTEHERRELIIARLPGLQRLNGGADITPKEREEAERNFIRRFHDSSVKPTRYEELVDVHGNVVPFAEVNLSPPKVANVWVRYGEQQWNEKRLSLYMTMKELREHFSGIVGLPAAKLRLWHCDEAQPMIMRFPAKRLYAYNVKDGDKFLIDEKL